MPWKISNAEKKNVTETEIWKKGDQYLKHHTGWRWGSWLIEDRSELDGYDPEAGIDMNTIDGETISMDDGVWDEWEFPEGMSQEDQDEIIAAWDEDWHDGITNLGWDEWETEVWLRGPLDIEEAEDVEDDEDEDFVAPALSEEAEALMEESRAAFDAYVKSKSETNTGNEEK
jgi:hypothetical protein